MKHVSSRLLSLLFALVLLAGLLPLGAAAQEELPTLRKTHINPLYEDSVTEEDLNKLENTPRFFSETTVYHTTVEDAAAYLRNCMELRMPLIAVGLADDSLENCTEEMMHTLFDTAVIHTGVPTEGDYLLWQYAGWDCGGSVSKSGSTYNMTFTYVMSYYTTAEQEEALTTQVNTVLENLDLEGRTDYMKIRAVYDYITENVAYDYDNLEDETYKLKHTAYAALMNKTAVCQGYALLLYRMALELGIDCRLISGIGNGGAHGWNIIKIGDHYYNADATWDAGETEYDYFLVTDDNFTNHTRDAEHTTDSFYAAFPMSEGDFNLATVASGTCGGDLTWVLTNDGTLTISGTGNMANYSESKCAPWSDYGTLVTSVIMEEGVSTIGSRAFSGFSGLIWMNIPASVGQIGACAFLDCSQLETLLFKGDSPIFDPAAFTNLSTTCYFPSSKCSWKTEVLQNYGGAVLWTPYDDGSVSTHLFGEVTTPPTCTGKGYTTHICTICGNSYADTYIDALGHSFTNYVPDENATCTSDGTRTARCDRCEVSDTVTDEGSMLPHDYDSVITAPTCTEDGYTTHTCTACGDSHVDSTTDALGHNFQDGICPACGAEEPDYAEPVNIIRLAGAHRWETSLKVADEMKANLGIEKFNSIIIASGNDFADALAGSYLATVKNAPILLSWGKGGNYAYLDENNIEYIKNNLASGGTVYILGGVNAVPALYETALPGYDVQRLGGANRFETNILILKEAGVQPNQEILVCTSTNFADSLSASATGLPILLVFNEYGKLYGAQPDYLKSLSGNTFCVVGGESAVSSALEAEISKYGTTFRLAGANRFETSVMVAEKYFENPDSAVLAYAWNYPDGLCGGPLAYTMGAPLILTMTKYEATAAAYTKGAAITSGIVLGGTGLISDEAVRVIFAINADDQIATK